MNVTLEVSAEVKRLTTRCKKDFACLQNNGDCLCPVDRVVGGQVVFVKCLQRSDCPYQHRYGFADCFCACPVRKEIYNKYKM